MQPAILQEELEGNFVSFSVILCGKAALQEELERG